MRTASGMSVVAVIMCALIGLSCSGSRRLEIEARQFADEYWGTYFIKCGDSYYVTVKTLLYYSIRDGISAERSIQRLGSDASNIREISDVTQPFQETKEREYVDQLMNVEWKGVSSFEFRRWRDYSLRDGQWGPWQETQNWKLSARIRKEGEKWLMYTANNSIVPRAEMAESFRFKDPLDCASIPE